MILSRFIVLEKLSLNANEKVDQKLFPSLDFSDVSSTDVRTDIKRKLLRKKIEITIHHICCEIFQQNQISIDTDLVDIGGHSLFHQYKIEFHLETNTLFITDLFQQPTIIDHDKLIHRAIDNTQKIDDNHWSTLHIIQSTKQVSIIINYFVVGQTSFA